MKNRNDDEKESGGESMFEIKKDAFYLNGEKFRLFSGAMHYFRVPKGYWDDRFLKMKAAGFNAVETVMCWNLHEPAEGKFDFSGNLDIAEFARAAKRHGLYFIVRPGPYTCGEWDNGGFPAWLLADKNRRIRCNDPDYLKKVEAYFRRVAAELLPEQIDRGGNVLMIQLENEYGSYGNDKEYLKSLERIIRSLGFTVPLFTSDGISPAMLSGGTLPHVYKTLNFGSGAKSAFRALTAFQSDLPKTCMEFWCGWFDHWGELHHGRNARFVEREIRVLIGTGANLNLYMFHGGTNFGFTAGANYTDRYLPVVTSYDDAALLNEYGDYTPAYHRVRKLLLKAQELPLNAPLPARPALQNVGTVALTERGALWDNLYRLGKRHRSATPESMERFGQNFGYVLYRTEIEGSYGASILHVEGAHDIAYLRVNGRLVKKYDRTKNRGKRHADGFCCKIEAIEQSATIEILVEGMGRINYGSETEKDRKGIQKVKLGIQTLFGWDVYTLPFDNLSEAVYDGDCAAGAPAILRGTFAADSGKDCFVELRGFRKGFVIVNGCNLGRYWERGPQRTLYCPATVLKPENEIVVVEQEGYREAAVQITDRHRLR